MTDSVNMIRVIDSETTGIDDPAEAVELGWTDVVRLQGTWGIIANPQSMLVDPGMPISYGAMATHHITDEMVFDATPADSARAKITAGADVLCAHNWSFDKRFVRSEKPAICTFKCARTIWPNLESYSNGAIRYELGLCIGDARAYPPHRAGPDTWITAHILLRLLAEGHSVDELIEISGKPVLLRKVDFGEHNGKLWSEVPTSYLDWILFKSTMPTDPKKEDVVHTVRIEFEKRKAAEPQPGAEGNYGYAHDPHDQVRDDSRRDPDAWRSQMEGA